MDEEVETSVSETETVEAAAAGAGTRRGRRGRHHSRKGDAIAGVNAPGYSACA